MRDELSEGISFVMVSSNLESLPTTDLRKLSRGGGYLAVKPVIDC